MAIHRSLAATLIVAMLALVACSGAATTTPATAPATMPPAAPTGPGVATPVPTRSAAAPSGTGSAPSSDPTTAPSDLLTVADVEKVSGLAGIKVVPRGSLLGAGGQINFATAGDEMVVLASFGDGAAFDTLTGSPDYREPLSGLGDAAFVGPSKDVMSTLDEVVFRKGDHTAVLTTFFVPVPKGQMPTLATMLSMKQLKALAAIVASRW